MLTSYTYEEHSDKRNEGPKQDQFVPKLYDANGKVYCSHNCSCQQTGIVTGDCQHIGICIDKQFEGEAG